MSYDDEHSVRLKAEFAFDMKLAGVMVWSVETDDFKVSIYNGVNMGLDQVDDLYATLKMI